jgi:nucleotide-binding universal stress UspA family protein
VFPVPARVVGDSGRTVAYVDQEMARLTAEGLAELQRTEVELNGVPVETVVRFGEPEEEIALEAESFDADLIALGAGRSSRMRSALAPSLADRVERGSAVPTLTLRR